MGNIMIIDVRKLKFSGNLQSDFTFEYFPEENLLNLPGAVLDGPVQVNVTSLLQGDDVYVDGTLKCKIVGECARCLKSAELDWSCEFSVIYATVRQDDDDYLYVNGRVDLTPAVYDALITSLPSVLYCKDDCKGLCHVCGQNINEATCSCKK